MGVLLYEMLTGTWPFRGKTTIDVRHAVLHDAARPIGELRPGAIPPRLQQIVDRAMAKEPRDRYQKMEDFRDDLRQVVKSNHQKRSTDNCAKPVNIPPRHS
jgi:serine/threonine-protein kinase